MLDSVLNTPLETEFTYIYLTNTLNQTFSTATVKRKSLRKKQHVCVIGDFLQWKTGIFQGIENRIFIFRQLIHISLN